MTPTIVGADVVAERISVRPSESIGEVLIFRRPGWLCFAQGQARFSVRARSRRTTTTTTTNSECWNTGRRGCAGHVVRYRALDVPAFV